MTSVVIPDLEIHDKIPLHLITNMSLIYFN